MEPFCYFPLIVTVGLLYQNTFKEKTLIISLNKVICL